jgi:tetratricopeptide (TPR) repeat protein
MERQRVRTLTRLIRGAALAVALTTVGACGGALKDARNAWDDGKGDFGETERLYREAIKDPKYDETAKEELAAIYLARGEQMVKKSKYKQGEEAFRNVLELDPKNEDAMAGLARCLREMYRFDEALVVARKGMESGECRPCRRLVAVLLIRRGDQFASENKWAEAEADYTEAQKIIPDAHVGLAIVRARYARGDLDGASKALRSAVALVGATDVTNRQQYLELQRVVVLLALEKGQAELADELLDLAPTGITGQEQLEAAMEVAVELGKQGKPDLALARLMALVQLAGEGKIQIVPEQLDKLRDRVALLHAARASLRLGEGDVDGAAKDLDEAVSLRPDDASFKLQRVLVTAGRNVGKARTELGKIGSNVEGYKDVNAILHALEVERLLKAGQVAQAKAELDKAKASSKDLPEVHIATAQWLAASEPLGLSKGQLGELKGKKGLVPYPGGKVTRVGEALSELDWSKQQIKGMGGTYPYRAPGTDQRLAELEDKLKSFFPFAVKFHGDPTAVLVLQNKGDGALPVEVQGGDVASKKDVPAGGSAKITLKKPGFTTLKFRGKDAAILTEPYTELEVSL